MFIKKSTLEKLLYTLLIYIGIFVLFGIAAYVYTVANVDPERRFLRSLSEDGMLYASMFLLVGGIGIFGLAGFAGFPFMSFIIINTIIYRFVRRLYNSGRLRALRIVVAVFVVFSFACLIPVYVYQSHISAVAGKKNSAQNKYYWEKYGTEEEVELPYKLMFAGNNNKVYLIDATGITETILYDYSDNQDIQIKYISPKGSYFVDTGFKGERERTSTSDCAC